MAISPPFLTIDKISHRAALVGRVLDPLSQRVIAGAQVVITSGPAAWTEKLAALQSGRPSLRPDVAVSDSFGFYRYLDLPEGAYALSATIPGAGTRYAASVTGNATVVLTAAVTLDFAFAPTAVTGLVKASAPAGPLPLARVRVVDSGEITHTASDGTYTLSPVEAGTNRVIEFSAQRYVTASLQVTVAQGTTTTASTVTITPG
jgi:hypothetical protein